MSPAESRMLPAPPPAPSAAILALLLTVPGLAARAPLASVARDFVDAFSSATVSRAAEASAGERQLSGGIARRGIFLHPRPRGDAVLTYAAVAVPAADDAARAFLLFDIGFRDGVPWGRQAGANGVRFRIRVAGEEVFSESVRGGGWRPRAVELSRWRGRSVPIEFRTNAIDGNSNYDWSVFARPMLVTLSRALRGDEPAADGGAGVVVAQIRCETPARVRLGVADALESADLAAGRRLLPLRFGRGGEFRFETLEGQARLEATYTGFFAPELVVEELLLSSPLVVAGRPLRVIAKLRNRGLGSQPAGETLPVSWSLESPGRPARRGALRLEIGPLKPRTERLVTTETFSLPAPGELSIHCSGESVASAVFPPRVDAPELSTDGRSPWPVRASAASWRR